jgi:hypothetical protein
MKITQVSQDPEIYVDPSVSLWRYIDLSTLFLNLTGTFYIPTLKELKKADPKEGLSAVSHYWVFGHLQDSAPDEIGKIEARLSDEDRKLARIADPKQVTKILIREWEKQLAESQCIWCWHASPHESAAMWRLYAKAGVAIATQLRRIEDSLPDGLSFTVAQLQYCNKEEEEWDSLNPEAEKNRNLFKHPYFFKNNDYEFENEVRLVTTSLSPGSGRLIEAISPTKLIERIVFSPWIHASEFRALQKRIKEMHPDNQFDISRSRLLETLEEEETRERMTKNMENVLDRRTASL